MQRKTYTNQHVLYWEPHEHDGGSDVVNRYKIEPTKTRDWPFSRSARQPKHSRIFLGYSRNTLRVLCKYPQNTDLMQCFLLVGSCSASSLRRDISFCAAFRMVSLLRIIFNATSDAPPTAAGPALRAPITQTIQNR